MGSAEANEIENVLGVRDGIDRKLIEEDKVEES